MDTLCWLSCTHTTSQSCSSTLCKAWTLRLPTFFRCVWLIVDHNVSQLTARLLLLLITVDGLANGGLIMHASTALTVLAALQPLLTKQLASHALCTRSWLFRAESSSQRLPHNLHLQGQLNNGLQTAMCSKRCLTNMWRTLPTSLTKLAVCVHTMVLYDCDVYSLHENQGMYSRCCPGTDVYCVLHTVYRCSLRYHKYSCQYRGCHAHSAAGGEYHQTLFAPCLAFAALS